MHTSLSINGTILTVAEIQAIEQQYVVQLAEGQYWYDRNCGAWGIEGGPTLGFVMPGISVGGPLRANSSGGNTNVFINGRELHYIDLLGLQQLLPVLPGRYWIDAHWNGGYEGGPTLFNLALLMRRRSSGNRGDRGVILPNTSQTTQPSAGMARASCMSQARIIMEIATHIILIP